MMVLSALDAYLSRHPLLVLYGSFSVTLGMIAEQKSIMIPNPQTLLSHPGLSSERFGMFAAVVLSQSLEFAKPGSSRMVALCGKAGLRHTRGTWLRSSN